MAFEIGKAWQNLEDRPTSINSFYGQCCMTWSFITILWNVISFMSSGGRTYQPNLPHPGQLWVKYILLGDVWIVSGIVIARNGVRSSVANTRKQCGWKGHKLSTSTMHRHSGLQLQQITMAADHSTAMAEDHRRGLYIHASEQHRAESCRRGPYKWTAAELHHRGS